jgi:hypothetical protein
MARFNKYQVITMIALILALFFNPMAYQVLKDYIEMFFTGISVVATLWVIGYLLKKVLTPEQVNIPKKAKKTTPKFIET